MAGGCRIVTSLEPQDGPAAAREQAFAAQTTSATAIGLASHFGIPPPGHPHLSSAVRGAGAAKRTGASRWTVVEQMAWAWTLTIPVSGALDWGLVRPAHLFGDRAVPTP